MGGNEIETCCENECDGIDVAGDGGQHEHAKHQHGSPGRERHGLVRRRGRGRIAVLHGRRERRRLALGCDRELRATAA